MCRGNRGWVPALLGTQPRGRAILELSRLPLLGDTGASRWLSGIGGLDQPAVAHVSRQSFAKIDCPAVTEDHWANHSWPTLPNPVPSREDGRMEPSGLPAFRFSAAAE